MEIYDCMEGVTLVQPEGRENGERVPDNGDSKTTTGSPIVLTSHIDGKIRLLEHRKWRWRDGKYG